MTGKKHFLHLRKKLELLISAKSLCMKYFRFFVFYIFFFTQLAFIFHLFYVL